LHGSSFPFPDVKTALLSGLLLAVILSAAFLGGDAGKGGDVVPVLGIGLVLFFAPVRAVPTGSVLIGLPGLLLSGLIGFLPARWFGEPPWHVMLRDAIPGLSRSVSLQPFYSGICFGVMLAVVLFVVWATQWRPVNRVRNLQVLAVGIAALAAVALAAHFYNFSVPWWHGSQGFGPFPNRNQTAALMALGAMIALGLLAGSARRLHWTGFFWGTVFLVCLLALLISNSRAALCLFLFAGLGWFFTRHEISAPRLTIAGGVLACVVAVALLVGGTVVGRLPGLLGENAGFRTDIYQDTAQLIRTVPLEGTGLGNFEAIFPSFREKSLSLQRIIHPESDWLWMVSEMGWCSLLFCGFVVAGLFRSPVHGVGEEDQDALVAGMFGLGAFICHSAIDVPGHRLGTILPAIVLLGLCFQPKLMGAGIKIIPWLSRLAGIGLVLFGLLLLKEEELSLKPHQELAEANWPEIRTSASDSLIRTPLNWSLYILRGYAEIRTTRWLEALADFRYARLLEPKLAIVPFDEGRGWMGSNTRLALDAWKDALQRSLPDQRNELYRQMLNASFGVASLHEGMVRLSDSDPELAMMALRSSHSDVRTLLFLEGETTELNSEQHRIVACAEARESALKKDFQEAYEMGRQNILPVVFPQQEQVSENECRAALIRNPGDFLAAYNLCLIFRADGRDPLNILTASAKQPNCPSYIYVMWAEELASRSNWADAWTVLSRLVR
jgi:O-Antigen ligase